MIFSYNWLKDYIIGKVPQPEKLAEVLTMHSFEVESVEKKGKDWILDIDVLPNRAHDCLSYLGVAREIAAILGLKLKEPNSEKLKKSKGRVKPIQIKIQCQELVPRYSAIVIEGVKISKSPQWLKEKLETLGIRSINNIVDLTNFVMLETGQPLHAFDYDKIKEQKMIVRQSDKGEKLFTLDNVRRILDKGMLVIEDKNRLIDLIGIMGGKTSEISSKTKNIILQAGNFDAQSIYSTCKKLKHSTDASHIYVHNIDPNLTIPALERAYSFLQELGGGEIVQIIDIYPKKVLPKKIKLDLNYVDRLLGIKIPNKEIMRILKNLGFIFHVSCSMFHVEAPTRRLDISIQEDLIEEIGRIAGYQEIISEFPCVDIKPPARNKEIFWENRVKDILKGLGFSEVYNYSFIGSREKEAIEIINPVSSLNRYLRPSLQPHLLKNVKDNFRFFDQVKIFELGKVFSKPPVKEKKMLALVLAKKQAKRDDFYELKGVVEALFEELGIKEANYTLERIQKAVFYFEMEFAEVLRKSSEAKDFKAIPSFPCSFRDLAVLTSKGIKFADIEAIIKKAGGNLLGPLELFDVYSGKNIPQGKQNFAFHITYQAKDRTLTSVEVDKAHQKIVRALEEKPGWKVRR